DAFRSTGRLSLEDFERHLCAADVVLSLRFPTHGEMSGALVRALGVGRPVVVSAGTPAADEFPEGIVAPVDPGPREEEELVAVLGRLLADARLREDMGRLARAHVREHHDLDASAAGLAAFLREAAAASAPLRRQILADRAAEGGLLGYLMEEVRWGARDLGLSRLPMDLDELLGALAGRQSWAGRRCRWSCRPSTRRSGCRARWSASHPTWPAGREATSCWWSTTGRPMRPPSAHRPG